MIKVFYYLARDGEHFLERLEECPPKIGERVELLTNQAFPNQKTLYAVEDVTTPVTTWVKGGGEAKKVLLRQIAIQGEVIMGGQGEVENP